MNEKKEGQSNTFHFSLVGVQLFAAGGSDVRVIKGKDTEDVRPVLSLLPDFEFQKYDVACEKWGMPICFMIERACEEKTVPPNSRMILLRFSILSSHIKNSVSFD
jgi:hypothetical protein